MENRNEIFSNSRQFHKALAPWVFLHYLYLLLQDFIHRVSKDIFVYSKDQVHGLMALHEGEWLGDNGELISVLLNSIGVL